MKVRQLVRALNKRRLLNLEVVATGCYSSEGDVLEVLLETKSGEQKPASWRGRARRVVLDTDVFTG